MGNAVAGVRPTFQHQAKAAFSEAFRSRERRRRRTSHEHSPMVSSDVRSVDDVLSRNDEDMRRRNRVQVPEGVDEIGERTSVDGTRPQRWPEEAVGHRRCRFLATVDSIGSG